MPRIYIENYDTAPPTKVEIDETYVVFETDNKDRFRIIVKGDHINVHLTRDKGNGDMFVTPRSSNVVEIR